jgi:hypothetical protein
VPHPTAPPRRTRLVLLLGLFLVAAGPAQAQEGPQVGVALGVNVATLDAPSAETSTRQLVTAGVVARMGVAGPVSVQGELLFSQKGATVTANGDAIRYGGGYLDLPLMLRVQGPTLGPVVLHGLAGGFGGLKIFERQRAGGDLSLPLPDADTNFFERTNAGLTGGLGGTVELGSGRRLNLVVRYSHGLVDVARAVDDQPFSSVPFPPEARTRTVSLLVHVGF